MMLSTAIDRGIAPDLPAASERRPMQTLLLVQALRAAAVLLVVCYHTGSVIFPEQKYFDVRPFGHLTDMGHAGVDLFFVISGFVITLAHDKDLGMPSRAMKYLRRRLTRIYPPYFVALAIVLLASLKLHGSNISVSPANALDNLLLVPATWEHEILSVSWTLRFEVLFYGLFLLCILNGRCFVPIMVALATLPIAGYCLAGFQHHAIVLLNPQLAQFVMGVVVARLFVRHRLRQPLTIGCFGTLLFTAAYARGVILGTEPGWDLVSVLLLGAASSCILYGLASAERSGRLAAPAWLVFLGGASYSIYLIHFPALSLLAKLWTGAGLRDALPATMTALLFAGLAVAAGCIFHLAVERPLLGWLQPARSRARARLDAPVA